MSTGHSRARAEHFARVGLPRDVPHQRSHRRSRELALVSVRTRPISMGTLRRIVAYVRQMRLFSGLDVQRAAERIHALHGDETLRWLRALAYRERHRPQGALTGERALNRKLDWDRVREIRRRYEAGESQNALARAFGVSQPTIGQIVYGVTWHEKKYRPPPTVWEQHGASSHDGVCEAGFERMWAALVTGLPESEYTAVETLVDRLVQGWLRVRERSCRMAPQPDGTFETWWKAYPRKVGKGDARKVWAQLKPSPALVEQMLATLAWQVETEQWNRDDGQYIPHPSTWLRQERWDDVPFAPVRALAPRSNGSRTGDTMDAARESLRRRLGRLADEDHDETALSPRRAGSADTRQPDALSCRPTREVKH